MKGMIWAASMAVIAAVAAVMTVSCTGKKAQSEQSTTEAPKYLVLYYSQSGATRMVAEELSNRLGADIEAVEVVDPYPQDFEETIARCQREMQSGRTPEIKPLQSNVSDYDVVFIGFPVWFGTYALPIAELVKNVDFAGKTVVPFCTFGSGGLETSTIDLKAALPKATVVEGYGVRNARLAAVPTEVNRFLVEREYIAGEVTALPCYSEQQPVTAEEKEIFEAACSDYRFPLGTPITVGKRGTDEGVDYEFVVEAGMKAGNGEKSTATIYVTVSNDSTARPEFTRVVRYRDEN